MGYAVGLDEEVVETTLKDDFVDEDEGLELELDVVDEDFVDEVETMVLELLEDLEELEMLVGDETGLQLEEERDVKRYICSLFPAPQYS